MSPPLVFVRECNFTYKGSKPSRISFHSTWVAQTSSWIYSGWKPLVVLCQLENTAIEVEVLFGRTYYHPKERSNHGEDVDIA